MHSSIRGKSNASSIIFNARAALDHEKDARIVEEPVFTISAAQEAMRRGGMGPLSDPLRQWPASMVNLLKATPSDQPLPLPDSASDTLPLVIACADALFSAAAWASAVA